MKGCTPLVALLAICATGSSETLRVKRAGGAGPVAVELAQERFEPSAGAASRFVELSHAVQGENTGSDSECLEVGCELTEESSELLKSLKKKLKKEVKERKKEVKEEKKRFLESHTDEEYELLKQDAILEALRRENNPPEEEAQK